MLCGRRKGSRLAKMFQRIKKRNFTTKYQDLQVAVLRCYVSRVDKLSSEME